MGAVAHFVQNLSLCFPLSVTLMEPGRFSDSINNNENLLCLFLLWSICFYVWWNLQRAVFFRRIPDMGRELCPLKKLWCLCWMVLMLTRPFFRNGMAMLIAAVIKVGHLGTWVRFNLLRWDVWEQWTMLSCTVGHRWKNPVRSLWQQWVSEVLTIGNEYEITKKLKYSNSKIYNWVIIVIQLELILPSPPEHSIDHLHLDRLLLNQLRPFHKWVS